MPVFALGERIEFPPPELADASGVLCVGGDLRPERLLAAYALGIFPWPEPGWPLLWHSPDPRHLLYPAELRIARRLRRTLRRGTFEVRLDTACEDVIAGCAAAPRAGQAGTWITREMRASYGRLHEAGYVHSAEAWRAGRLVGGLYGVALGGSFCGESMYAAETDASKVALVHLVRQLGAWGFCFLDCQVHSEHLARFGGRDVPRMQYLRELREAMELPTRRGRWVLDAQVAAAGW